MLYDFSIEHHQGDRPTQEDQVCIIAHPSNPDFVLAVVADGLGGHAGGGEASAAVIESVEREFRQFSPNVDQARNQLVKAVQAAHTQVTRLSQGGGYEPHSTIVIALASPDRFDWAHCGDSRLYLFRDEKFIRRTEDHTLSEILRRQGVIDERAAKTHPKRNQLFSFLGGVESPVVTMGGIEYPEPEDTILLASDGLWAYFEPFEMAQIIGYRSLPSAGARLIDLARKRANGMGDNLSLALIRNKQATTDKQKLLGGLVDADQNKKLTRILMRSTVCRTLFNLPRPVPSPLEDARRYLRYLVNRTEAEIRPQLLEQIQQAALVDKMLEVINRCEQELSPYWGDQEAAAVASRAQELLVS